MSVDGIAGLGNFVTCRWERFFGILCTLWLTACSGLGAVHSDFGGTYAYRTVLLLRNFLCNEGEGARLGHFDI